MKATKTPYQMSRRSRRTRQLFRQGERTGLAPLEMVLALPLVLFIMALMINFGTVASWRVRGLVMSQHAAWQTRHPRSLSRSPRPDFWPASANVGVGGAADANSLDDPRADLPAMRGPGVGDFGVRRELFDPSRGVREGSSSLDRTFPLLPSLGAYHLRSHVTLLDNCWDFPRTGQPRNNHRRIPAIYLLPVAAPGYSQAYVQAAIAIMSMPLRNALRTLDNDDEFIGYNLRFMWGSGAPDFHPRVGRFCSLDLSTARAQVEDTLDRIYGRLETDDARRIPSLPERMASSFINLYERVIDELQAQLDAGPPPGQAGAIQAEIDQLRQRIAVLEAFRQSLQNHGR